jgi:hypothetical protein
MVGFRKIAVLEHGVVHGPEFALLMGGEAGLCLLFS